MPYKFSFDLSKMPQAFFQELACIASDKALHKQWGSKTRCLAYDFKVSEVTGLAVPETIQLVEDFVDICVKNQSERDYFNKTKKRALFLPHCSRKYMDKRCGAVFQAEVPSYKCGKCSDDCLVCQATKLGEARGYSVYVLPGSSCIQSILKKDKYEGVIGVACGQELSLGISLLKQMGYAAQAIPLIKNGCTNTSFDVSSLERTL
jgi:hypothetical protein